MRPPATQHPSAADLAAFASGQLDDTQIELVGRHIGECQACRDAVKRAPVDGLVQRLRDVNVYRLASPHAATPSLQGSVTTGELPPPAPAIDPADLPETLRDHAKYRIVRQLGQGGMGVVYQAEHRVMERLLAIKVINHKLVDHPEAAERFEREIRAAAQLDHRNIVRAYDAERAGDLQLLAMEFVEGQSLAELLVKKGPLPIAYACNYVLQAALGLQHAHERNMVHRDIKPQNLMLTTKGVVKILDFGLARLRSERRTSNELTRDYAMMGTPEYIAPEQAQDSKKADIRADIYSLGCTLFFLLTGRPPFRGSDWLAVVMSHLKDAPPPLENWRTDVPTELADLVTRMLAKDPAARPQTPKEVAEELLPFTKPARATQTTAPRAVVRTNRAALARPGDSEDTVDEPAPGPSKRLRWLIPTAAAAAVLLGFGAWGIVHALKTTDGTAAVAVNEPTVERKLNPADDTPKSPDPPRLQTPAEPKAAEPKPADPQPAPKPEEPKAASPVPPGVPPVAKDGEKPIPVMPVVPVQPAPPIQPAPNPSPPVIVIPILPLLPPPPAFTNAQRPLATGIELLRVVDQALFNLNVSPQDPGGPQKDVWRQDARKELAEAYRDILANKRGKDVKENLTKAKELIHHLESGAVPANGKAPSAPKGKGKGKASQDKNRGPLGQIEAALDRAIAEFKQARIID